MNVVFVNSLEKKIEGERVITAQVSIGEQQGSWSVVWNEPNGGRMEQQVWFEGNEWDKMLGVFRSRIAEKLLEGYIPLIRSMGGEDDFSSQRARWLSMLRYYSELNSREEVFEKLRSWRRDMAVKEGKAPFIIATNRVLRMISAYLPQTKDELLQIPGLGVNKSTLYADAISAITGPVKRTTRFPLDWVAAEIDEPSFLEWVHQQRELKAKEELDKRVVKRTLLEGLINGRDVNSLQEQTGISRRELVQWVEQLDQEGYDLEEWIDKQLAFVTETDRQAAWKAFEEEGDRYLKPVLRRIGCEEKGEDVDRVYEWLRLLRLKFRREKTAGNQAS